MANIVGGWKGRFYEDFTVGDVYIHPYGRTITEADNIWFTLLTMNMNEIHFNADYAAETEWGRPLVNSALTLAVVLGMSVMDVSQNAINLGWEEIKLPNPVFAGDTLYAQTEVLEKRESRSRPHMGIVKLKTIGYNQDGKIVLEMKRTIMVWKKAYAPRSKIEEKRRKIAGEK
ncbi:MAG: MaoC family dehydratase [Aigarchaeota archaeon]|nr:MaoC family dehydratase [Candidatus Pelearchaeum maunauluense]